MPEVTLVEAINLALARAMEDDPNVVVFGEDVGVNGGVFRATVGLQQRFGPERVFDTPLAELLISGLCVGMAAQGLRPVGEIQFMGFIYPCIDQLVNHASRLRNRTQGRLSLSDGFTDAAWGRHSRSRTSLRECRGHARPYSRSARGHSIFARTRLRPAARHHPRPRSGGVPGADAHLPRIERRGERQRRGPATGCRLYPQEGRDVTLISWGAVVKETLAAAETLDAEGISAEVIDLATLKPYDEETLLSSVAKTGRCVIVHEAARTGGFGAEIAALIAERGLTSLLAPVARITGYDTVMPLPRLEQHYMPSVSRIAAAGRKACQFS